MARKPQPRKVKKDQLEKDQDEIPADEDKKEADNDESPASPPPIQRKTLTGTDVGSDDEREDLEDKSQQEPKKGQDKTAGVDDSLESEPKPGKETSKTKKKGTKATKPKQKEPKKGQVETAGVDDSLDSKPKPGKETSKRRRVPRQPNQNRSRTAGSQTRRQTTATTLTKTQKLERMKETLLTARMRRSQKRVRTKQQVSMTHLIASRNQARR